MKYSIIVAIDNNFALTNNFIEILLASTKLGQNNELVIILDGCNNIQTINYLDSLSERNLPIKVLRNDSKKGYGIANNIAVDNSKGDILVFINSDVFPLKGSIDKLVTFLSENRETVGAAQGLLIYPQDNKVQSTGHLFLELQNNHIYQGSSIHNPVIEKRAKRQAITTAFCAITREVFLKNGKFNEYYYNAYEGFELTLKITLSGLKCMYYPEAKAYHICGGTRDSMDISETQQSKYFIQNWGDKIVTDIDQYIAPQLNNFHLKRMYTVIILSQLKGWETILNKLQLNVNGYITLPCYGNIDLYQLFPYSFLDFGGNYLFIVDSIKNISRNCNWIENRKRYHDIVMDSHGNMIDMRELI